MKRSGPSWERLMLRWSVRRWAGASTQASSRRSTRSARRSPQHVHLHSKTTQQCHNATHHNIKISQDHKITRSQDQNIKISKYHNNMYTRNRKENAIGTNEGQEKEKINFLLIKVFAKKFPTFLGNNNRVPWYAKLLSRTIRCECVEARSTRKGNRKFYPWF